MTTLRRIWKPLAGVLAIVAAVAAYVGWYRFFRAEPQPEWVTATADMRFKYGSIGGEYDAGIPYWIFYVLPRVFPEKLPGPGGYASFGVAWEEGQELPIGFTKKKIGFDRVGNNCASCHTTSYRETVDSKPVFVVTGPNHRLKLQAFFRFLVDCAKDPRFTSQILMHEINLVTELDLIDRLAYRFLIIPITKKTLVAREDQFAWIYRTDFPPWGPGRDDAMNLTKYFMLGEKMDDTFGPTDMPSFWNLKKYQPEQGHLLNWAGDSHDPRSVIIDSALGVLGAEPHDIADFLEQMAWLEKYLGEKPPPSYPFATDAVRAGAGKALFDQHCAGCHASTRTGTVIQLQEINTDPERIRTWSGKAAIAANKVVADMGIRRKGLVEKDPTGYVAQFLDGIWLRAPYLHNGSVPTLRDLLDAPDQRPVRFYRGYDVYDPIKVGFVTSGADAERVGSAFDTRQRGSGNGGHAYGAGLSEAEKGDLVEFLKSL